MVTRAAIDLVSAGRQSVWSRLRRQHPAGSVISVRAAGAAVVPALQRPARAGGRCFVPDLRSARRARPADGPGHLGDVPSLRGDCQRRCERHERRPDDPDRARRARAAAHRGRGARRNRRRLQGLCPGLAATDPCLGGHTCISCGRRGCCRGVVARRFAVGPGQHPPEFPAHRHQQVVALLLARPRPAIPAAEPGSATHDRSGLCVGRAHCRGDVLPGSIAPRRGRRGRACLPGHAVHGLVVDGGIPAGNRSGAELVRRSVARATRR